MKKTFIFAVLLSLVLLLGCDKKETQSGQAELPPKEETQAPKQEQVQEKSAPAFSIQYGEGKELLASYYELSHIQDFYDDRGFEAVPLPPLEVPEDLTSLSYEELRLKRNEVFARNGYLFSDGFLRGYFNQFKWYRPIFDVEDFEVVFNEKEKKLIADIQAEEAKRKTNPTVEKGGLKLLNADLVVNTRQFGEVDPVILSDLTENNFCIVDADRPMPFYVYDRNAYEHVPNYITTDAYLFILHKYFSSFLEKLESNHLRNELAAMLKKNSAKLASMPAGDHTAAIDWAQTFNGLALHALGEKPEAIPELYQNIFNTEAKHIDGEGGKALFVKNPFVDFGELAPRGHYTKSESLKSYFKAFKWLSLNGINLQNKTQFKGLLVLAFSIKNDPELLKQYREYVAIVEKLAGREDNLSMSDVVKLMDATTLDEALSDASVGKLRAGLNALDKERIRPVFGESLATNEDKTKRLHFFSATWSPGAEIFSNLVHVDLDKSKRPFPRALDVPAVFGNVSFG
jgi:hypothetical protein